MKRLTFLYLFISIVVISCDNATPSQQPAVDTTTKIPATDTGNISEDIVNEYEDAYVVIADTGNNYMMLDDHLYMLGNKLRLPVDTMNRHYDKLKHKIVLAEDDEDEMYRGEYYPRRSEDTSFLSLEHADQYFAANTCDTNVFALVADICSNQKRADSIRKWILPAAPNTMVVKTKIYTGCMH